MTTESKTTVDLQDERGYYPISALTGMALVLAEKVSDIVDQTGQPAEMTAIRKLACEITLHDPDSNPHVIEPGLQRFVEVHYYEHSQWFSRMEFCDGSHITWGESEDV